MEIPIIHETTSIKSGTPVSAPLLISSTLPAATNHFFHPSSGSGKSQHLLHEGNGHIDMHREEVVVTTSYKPKTPAKPNFRKGENDSFRSTQRSLHTRLPSADSGIQADGGFDSLSRYRGKTFLSASNADDTAVTDDSVSSTSAIQIKNSGYSGGQPQQKLPLVSRVVSLPSKSFFTTSTTTATPTSSPRSSSTSQSTTPAVKAPVPAVRTSLTSLHNASKSLESRSEPNQTTPSRNGTSAPEALDPSPAFTESQVTSTLSNQNSNPSALKTVSNRKPGINVSITNQNMDLSSQTNHKKANSDQNVPIKISPNVKVASNPNSGVKIAISKNTVNITQARSATPSANDVVTFQMVHPAKAGQPDANKNRGPGCIALTRPLRLGAPPAPSAARSATSVTLNTQPPTSQQQAATPQVRGQPPPLPSQPPRVTTNSSVRVKPKIAPRPSIASKPSPQSSPSKSSTGESKTTALSIENDTSSDNPHNNNTEIKIVTEIPITYRPSTPGSQSSRVEIPVKHIESNSQTCLLNISKPTSLGTPSFSRYTPERQLHQRQSIYERLASEKEKQHLLKFPIYENVFNIKDGFSFDDPSSRMKQAELILKQSDELINDALKMLGTSPSPLISPKQSKRNGFSVDVREFPDGERVVEGSDAPPTASSDREHHVPIFDVQSGKMFCGPRTTFADGAGVTSASTDNKVKDVIWNEKKNRIDAALSWLKTELASLREMDNTLISHFKRCQETIDALKTQRDVWDGLSEEGEDGEYWDDYEITEFNRKYLDSPGGSESSHLSPISRDPSLQDVSSVSIPVPQLHLPQSSPDPSHRRGSVTQDVEAML